MYLMWDDLIVSYGINPPLHWLPLEWFELIEGISDPMSQTDRSLTNHQLDPPSFISGAIGEDTNQLVLNQGTKYRITAHGIAWHCSSPPVALCQFPMHQQV